MTSCLPTTWWLLILTPIWWKVITRRHRTPQRTPTSTSTCPRLAGWCIPTRRTPRRAARGEPIPCVLTMIADEFGGDIPVGPFALIGDDSVGRGIVETLSGHRSSAVLMKNHGVFTIGATAMAAVKAAVMCEDVARTVHIARQIGQPLPIAQSDVDSLFDRYQRVYGQR